MKMKCIFLLCVSVLLLSACHTSIPKDALLLSPESLANRQLQTRRFETSDNQAMLSAASAVMQDLGFNLDESEPTLGVLVGSKTRDAVSGGQVAGAIILAFFGANMAIDVLQTVRVSMVMREVEPSEPKQADVNKTIRQSTVRVTFQRVILNEHNQISRLEQINDPEIYKEFFDKLSQSVFLEAHEI